MVRAMLDDVVDAVVSQGSQPDNAELPPPEPQETPPTDSTPPPSINNSTNSVGGGASSTGDSESLSSQPEPGIVGNVVSGSGLSRVPSQVFIFF